MLGEHTPNVVSWPTNRPAPARVERERENARITRERKYAREMAYRATHEQRRDPPGEHATHEQRRDPDMEEKVKIIAEWQQQVAAAAAAGRPLPPRPKKPRERATHEQRRDAPRERDKRQKQHVRDVPPIPTGSCRKADVMPFLTFVIQYFMHPKQLLPICEKLCDPRIEIIVHADSSTDHDVRALRRAEKLYSATIIHSDNIHEIRGYNLAAKKAVGRFLAFSQDDRIPPSARCENHDGGWSPCWLDSVLNVFRHPQLSKLGAIGLHRGGHEVWVEAPRQTLFGSCGDTVDDGEGMKWVSLPSEGMRHPLRYAATLNIGPYIIRKKVFEEMGGFNESYSKVGQMGIGFDFELTARLWMRGWTAAVICPSSQTAFRNGCGGKGSTKVQGERKQLESAHYDLYYEQFHKGGYRKAINDDVALAQRKLVRNFELVRYLREQIPGCVDCSRASLAQRALGFTDPTRCAGNATVLEIHDDKTDEHLAVHHVAG